MTAPKFYWKGSAFGYQWFQVYDATGTYEAELRHSVGAYELSIANGDDVRRDMQGAIGLLVRHASVPDEGGGRTFAVPQATLEAFNAWRLAEHESAVAKIRAHPERYGVLDDDDPILRAPMVARRGTYVTGEGWSEV